MECAAINAEDVPYEKFGEDANLYPWEKRDIIVCYLCLENGEVPNRMGQTVLPDGIVKDTPPADQNKKPPPEVHCTKRSCKSGGVAMKCSFPTCLEYRCVPCNTQFFGKKEWPLLYEEDSGDMVVVCTKKHYATVVKNLGSSSQRLPWNADGPKGYDDPVNSELLLVEWLCEEGNYAKYRGSDNGGKSKISFCQDIANMLKRRGMRSERSAKNVLDKITNIENRFRHAFDFAHQTGAGLKSKGDGTFEETLTKKFRYYFDLLPIIADRASAHPSTTSDDHNKGRGYQSEVDDEDDSKSNTQGTSAVFDDDNDDEDVDFEQDSEPIDYLGHGDDHPTEEPTEENDTNDNVAVDIVDQTPKKDNTDLSNKASGSQTSSKVTRKRKAVASSKKKAVKKKTGNFKIDHRLLIDSDEETATSETQNKLVLQSRLKKTELMEHKRHNIEMETIQRENNKWENKQKELAYKRQLWTQFKELKETGLEDEQIVEIFPDMKDFITKK